MNNEEKILEMLGQINGRLDQMDGRMDQMQTDLTEVKADLTHVKADLTEVKADLTHVKARLDLDVDKRLGALAEGQSAIVEKLSVLDEVKELAEDTSEKVDVIHAVVAQHSKSITELKKAK